MRQTRETASFPESIRVPGVDRPAAVRRDFHGIGDESAAGPAERTVQGLRLPIERRVTNVSLHELSPYVSFPRLGSPAAKAPKG